MIWLQITLYAIFVNRIKISTLKLGWGSGNKEWTIDFPEGEEAQSLAVGNNFVAVATDRRNLRLFMIGGTQREIIALPGSVVAMNAHNNHLIVTYHTGVGKNDSFLLLLLYVYIIYYLFIFYKYNIYKIENVTV